MLEYKDNPDWYFRVAQGRVEGWKFINKWGLNEDIDSGTVPETIWSRGGLHVPPTAARIHAIASTSSDDTSDGTGARSIIIFGNDENFDEITEVVALSGMTPVNTTKAFRRIWRMRILTAGAGQANAGTITATAATDTTVTAEIPTGYGFTEMAIFTVPMNKSLYISEFFAAAHRAGGGAKQIVDLTFIVRGPLSSSVPTLVRVEDIALNDEATSFIRDVARHPRVVVGPADVEIRCVYSSIDNAHISAGFSGVYG